MLRFTVASAFQKTHLPQNHIFGLSSNINQDHRQLPQRLQWLARFPNIARSLEADQLKQREVSEQ